MYFLLCLTNKNLYKSYFYTHIKFCLHFTDHCWLFHGTVSAVSCKFHMLRQKCAFFYPKDSAYTHLLASRGMSLIPHVVSTIIVHPMCSQRYVLNNHTCICVAVVFTCFAFVLFVRLCSTKHPSLNLAYFPFYKLRTSMLHFIPPFLIK